MIAFRVLVVDDDPDDRDFIRTALESAGIEPILAIESAQDVFLYLQKVENDADLPRLIMTDLNMPGISGYELLLALRSMSRYQHIPVIVCSTSSYALDVKNCLNAGASHFVSKPATVTGYDKISNDVKQFLAG